MDDPARVMVVAGAKPSALLWIRGPTTLEVGEAGPAWNGNIDQKTRVPTDLANVRKRVLEAIAATKGPAARAAKQLLRDEDESEPTGTREPSWDPAMPAKGRLPAAAAVAIDKLAPTAPLVIARPSVPAPAIARALAHTGGALAVDHQGKLGVLALAFDIAMAPNTLGEQAWLELWADAKGLHVLTQPDDTERIVEWKGASVDAAKLAETVTATGKEWCDVLVRDDTTTQTLVELLAALDAAGVKHVAVAVGPANPDDRRGQIMLSRRLQRATPTVQPGTVTTQGDLDKDAIATTIKSQLAKVTYCYEKQLLVQPYLAGTVDTQFSIGPDGRVTQADATGVDTEVASCIKAVLLQLEFPKPTGGGSVIVHYPFVFSS